MSRAPLEGVMHSIARPTGSALPALLASIQDILAIPWSISNTDNLTRSAHRCVNFYKWLFIIAEVHHNVKLFAVTSSLYYAGGDLGILLNWECQTAIKIKLDISICRYFYSKAVLWKSFASGAPCSTRWFCFVSYDGTKWNYISIQIQYASPIHCGQFASQFSVKLTNALSSNQLNISLFQSYFDSPQI